MAISVYPQPATGATPAQEPVYSIALTNGKKYTTSNCSTSATYFLSVKGNNGQEYGVQQGTTKIFAILSIFSNSNTALSKTVEIYENQDYVLQGTIDSFVVTHCSSGAILNITKTANTTPSSQTVIPANILSGGNDLIPMGSYESYYGGGDYNQRRAMCYSSDDTEIYYINKVYYSFYKKNLSTNIITTLAQAPSAFTSYYNVAGLFDVGTSIYFIYTAAGSNTWYFAEYVKSTNTWFNRLSWTSNTISESNSLNTGSKYLGFTQGANGYRIGTRFFCPNYLGEFYIETSTWTRTAMASNTVTSGAPFRQNYTLVNGKIYFTSPYSVSNVATFSPSTGAQSIGVYNPTTNTWTQLSIPTYNILGGHIFRWSSTEFALTGSAPVQSNASNANSYATNGKLGLWTYDTNSSNWTDRSDDMGYQPILSWPGAAQNYYQGLVQRQTSTYDKTFSMFIRQTDQGWGNKGPINAGGIFVDFRNIGTNKNKIQIIGQDQVRPLVYPGRKYCLAAGHTGFNNGTYTSVSSYGLWGMYSNSTSNTNYSVLFKASGIIATSPDGSFVKNIMPNVNVVAGCYDIVNGGAWYFYVNFIDTPTSWNGSSIAQFQSVSSGFIRVNESDLSVDILSKQIGSSSSSGTNLGSPGNSNYPQGLTWVYDGYMYTLSGDTFTDTVVYNMSTGTNQSVFPNGSAYPAQYKIYSQGVNDTQPRSDAGYYGLNYYRWSTWVGFLNDFNSVMKTPTPIFWNGRDLWYPNGIVEISGYASGAVNLASFEAGGIVQQRPPSVYYNPETDRYTCETSNGFVDFGRFSPSSSKAYVFTASLGSTRFIPAQSSRATGGSSYAQNWGDQANDFYGNPENGYSYKYQGAHSPKAMMGNTQLYFGALAIFNAQNPSTNIIYFVDNNVFRMVV